MKYPTPGLTQTSETIRNHRSYVCVCAHCMCATLHLHLSLYYEEQLFRFNEISFITSALNGLFQQQNNSGLLKDDICLPFIKLFCQSASFFIWQQERSLLQWSWKTPKRRGGRGILKKRTDRKPG